MEQLYLFWIGYKWYIRVQHAKALHSEFMIYLWENDWPSICHICGERVSRRERSIDHLIPVSICYKLNMPELVLDKRNFALSHLRCNWKRGNKISDLPIVVQEKIKALDNH